jgi:citrate lyase beta subunit
MDQSHIDMQVRIITRLIKDYGPDHEMVREARRVLNGMEYAKHGGLSSAKESFTRRV